ncbi:MAG: AAA family ATPase [Gemmataceae bacterium]
MSSLASANPVHFPYATTSVEVVQTHISIVFLAPPFVYKVKKPVSLGFLDFSTLEKRRHFCEQEVTLNRRLASDVYVGVVPVVADGGGIRFEGEGEPIEWAVKMRWLDEEHSLKCIVERDEAVDELIDSLARRIAEFHRHAETNEHIVSFGSLDIVSGNVRENFEQCLSHIGQTVSWSVFDRVRACSDRLMIRRRQQIVDRAKRGVPRDTHGDLRLDHVYFLPEGIAIIDCIEFNERFRYADPVADIAFLTMDLAWAGRRDLANRLADAYFAASGDEEGRPLLAAYEGYRAAVRAKVNGIQFFEDGISTERKDRAKQRALGHWLLALSLMEEPNRRPGVLLIGGLPGTGKSTLARTLAEKHGFQLLRSDVVRKELAGIAESKSTSVGVGQGIYDAEWNERTYQELLDQRGTHRVANGG